MTLSLDDAREARDELLLDEAIDQQLALLFSAKTVGPEARFKLRNLLKFYAKKAKPFTACVRDNRKRFPAPGEVERICATVVDLIKGNTQWRHGGRSSHGKLMASDDIETPPIIDDDLRDIILGLPQPDQDRLEKIYQEVREVTSA